MKNRQSEKPQMATKSPAGSSEREALLLDALQDAERTAYVLGRPVPVPKRIARPAFTWEEAVPGLIFPALEYVVSRAAVESYLRLQALIFGNCSALVEHVPLAFFADEPMQCIGTRFAQAGRLHVGHKLEGLSAIPIGSSVRSRTIVANRYEKSGRQFIEIESIVYVLNGADERPAARIGALLIL